MIKFKVMKSIRNKHIHTAQKIITIALLSVSGLSYFSFNYFHLFGHIQSFSDFLFCLLQWVKLSGLVMLPAAVFLKTERFTATIKWLLVITPLASLGFIMRYIGLQHTPAHLHQELYAHINRFMPVALIAVLFVLEALLLAAAAVLFWVRDGLKIRVMSDIGNKNTPAQAVKRSVLSFLPVFFCVIPLNLFDNVVRLFPESVYNFLKFGNFTMWHLAVFQFVFLATFLAFRFLKKKDSAARRKYLTVFCIAMLVQYMNKASMLIGDGYNVYYTVLAFIPLFICNIGVLIAALAVFVWKNKTLHNLSFFVHAAGALTVFFYFGKAEMSNYGTVLSYTFLYFAFTHCALFMVCVLPVLLGEHKFSIKGKGSLVPMAYYAGVILVAALTSEIITAATGALYLTSHGEAAVIYPNFAFTQNSPIANSLPKLNLKIGALTFDMLYLSILFLAYVAIFFIYYAGYYALIELRKKRNPKTTLTAETDPATILSALAETAAAVDAETTEIPKDTLLVDEPKN